MPSKFAVELAPKFPTLKFIPKTALRDYAPLYDTIDAELAEVREVLLTTARHKTSDGPCWCVVYMRTMPHMEDCQRAREIYEKLKV